MTVRSLPPKAVRSHARSPFVPWQPPLSLVASRDPAPRRTRVAAGPDLAAARRVGELLAPEVMEEANDPPVWEGRSADEVYAIATHQLDDILPGKPEHREMMRQVRAWGARPEGAALRSAYVAGVLDALWSAARRAKPRHPSAARRDDGESWRPT